MRFTTVYILKKIVNKVSIIKEQLVLKRVKGRLKYSESKDSRDAVEQFGTLLERAVESVEDKKRSRENSEGVLVDTNTECIDSESQSDRPREIGRSVEF